MTFKYLASPYTHPDPLIREIRYIHTMEALKRLMMHGHSVYSPIVMCHHMAQIWEMPKDHRFWLLHDTEMILSSVGVMVLRLEGWETSVGVKREIEFAEGVGKPVEYL